MTDLVDLHGRPLRKEVLTREIAGPTVGGVRSPIAGYPADGLNPVRLAQILRSADMGDPQRYFELAETIEERDPHYVGVLGTRKRSVSQIDVSVIAASDAPLDVELADMVREWLDRDELTDETFDILDAIGKGVSYTEIIWDVSEGQWRPDRLERVEQRWIEYDRRDGRTPLLRGGESGRGQASPLEPFKFIQHTVKAKSGLAVRSGIARIAAWGWMFKAFTQRDWAIFAQTYGQPVRIGKFAPGASSDDRATLFRAVANIAGDMAAIIPQGMEIEFIESGNVGPGSDLYEKRADWLDRQISKAVLGQTGTTDAKVGGLGDGGNKVHERVAEDIETADCKGLAATLNRDLVRPWVDLERGPQLKYPRIRIARPKKEDLTGLADGLVKLVPLGLKVQMSEIRDRFGISDPDDGAELLSAPTTITLPSPALTTSLQSSARDRAPSTVDQIADRMVVEAMPAIGEWFTDLQAMMAAATSLPELREMVRSAYPRLSTTQVAALLGDGFAATHAAGMSDVEETGAS
jgi:phage gp29-like protein